MMAEFRVTARTNEGETLALETFASNGDAESFMSEMVKDADSILSLWGVRIVALSKETLEEGEWRLKERKLLWL